MNVYLVTVAGHSPDRICDSAETAKALCDDYLACLGVKRPIIEDWTDLSAARDGGLWVRYFGEDRWRQGRATWEHVEQRIERKRVSTSGKWFEATPLVGGAS